jgi:hypothetical protein
MSVFYVPLKGISMVIQGSLYRSARCRSYRKDLHVEATMDMAPTHTSQGGLRKLKKLFLLLAGITTGAAFVLR